MNVAEFTGSCGENSSASSGAGLQVNQQVELNGNTDLSSCVQANGGGCVYSVTLSNSPDPIYDYILNVDAQGPSGIFSGSMHLAFTDQTSDTYHLAVFSSERKMHTLQYNSKQPAIMSFQWSNTSI